MPTQSTRLPAQAQGDSPPIGSRSSVMLSGVECVAPSLECATPHCGRGTQHRPKALPCAQGPKTGRQASQTALSLLGRGRAKRPRAVCLAPLLMLAAAGRQSSNRCVHRQSHARGGRSTRAHQPGARALVDATTRPKPSPRRHADPS